MRVAVPTSMSLRENDKASWVVKKSTTSRKGEILEKGFLSNVVRIK